MIKKIIKKIVIVFLSVIFLLIVYIILILKLPPNLLYRSEYKSVNKLVKIIEDYKKDKGHYPDIEFLWKNYPKLYFENRMYYINEDNYFVIGFTVGFDEMYEYDSRTKKWNFE